MMKGLFRRALLRGLILLLPLLVFVLVVRWLYLTMAELTAPLAGQLETGVGLSAWLAELTGVLALLLLFMAVGLLVMIPLGNWFWTRLESRVVARLPGYTPIREIITQVLGHREDSPLRRGEVARVWIYGRQAEVSVLGLVTARWPDGNMTVFVPTGPNPTTGFIYLVPPDVVTLCPQIKVEQMMKVVVACGAGSQLLFQEPGSARGHPEEGR